MVLDLSLHVLLQIRILHFPSRFYNYVHSELQILNFVLTKCTVELISTIFLGFYGLALSVGLSVNHISI